MRKVATSFDPIHLLAIRTRWIDGGTIDVSDIEPELGERPKMHNSLDSEAKDND